MSVRVYVCSCIEVPSYTEPSVRKGCEIWQKFGKTTRMGYITLLTAITSLR